MSTNIDPPMDLTEATTPSLLRRLAAMLYDGLLLTALIFVTTAGITLPFGNPTGGALLAFQLFIFEIIPLAFFSGFWVQGGQTLGMRAWRLKLVRMDGGKVRWPDAIKRHFASLLSLLICGLGFLWVLLDSEKFAWHDRLSNTRLLVVK
ncbi:MAG: RDD family protein [Candidatus Thiodiazotropha sp.]|jgi:uncharacterized RDD family membrane protein YckC